MNLEFKMLKNRLKMMKKNLNQELSRYKNKSLLIKRNLKSLIKSPNYQYKQKKMNNYNKI